uniref:Uncharacterized protein n=1 Tax=Anguilla anguilla TaxID=7936 RepID=A0A0E9Q592_ANGAN
MEWLRVRRQIGSAMT